MSPDPLLDRIVNSSIQGLLFLLVIWAICGFAKRLRPQTRQWLWWIGSLKLVLGLLWTLPIVVHSNAESVAPIRHFLPQTGSHQAITAAMDTVQPGIAWPVILLAAWIGGLAFFTLRSGFEIYRLSALLKAASLYTDSESGQTLRRLALDMGVSSPPRLMLSDRISSPLLALPFRPTILLPTDFAQALTREEQEMALAHELAHLRRNDLWTAIVPSLARTLFFFLPPAWLAAREFAADSEAACDQAALDVTGNGRKRYCELLLKMVERDHRKIAVPALGATHRFHTLKRRIELMGSAPASPAPLALIVVAIAAVLAIPFHVEAGQRAAKPQGILVNAGFEEGRKTPAGWTTGQEIHGVQYLWDRTTSHTGQASLCISKAADRYFPIAQWRQTIPYDGKAKKLELSSWVKAHNAYKSVLNVEFIADDGIAGHQWAAYIGAEKEDDPPADHNWRLYSGTVDIPEGTRKIVICLETYGPGTTWFDDVQALFHN